MGPFATGEITLARDVVPAFRKGMLCLADRFFSGYDLWQTAAKTGVGPKQAPAKELAALDELKTHLRGAQIVLRSKTPALVEQEFWGLLMAHFAIRGLMHEAAPKADEDPGRLCFLHAVRVARYAAIPPSAGEGPA